MKGAEPDIEGAAVGWLNILRGGCTTKALIRSRAVFLCAIALAAISPACRNDAPHRAIATLPSAIDTGRVAISGGSLYWQAAGTGVPVVLIHGGNLDHRMWDAQFDTLRHHVRVIRYDARGFGRSSAADRPFRAPDDLAALLRALNIPRAILVGLSMGGGIAIDFALAYPDMVDRLVLAAPSVSGGTWPYDNDTLWLAEGRAAFARNDSLGLALSWLKSDYIRSALRTAADSARLREIITDNAAHLMRRARDENSVRENSPPSVGRLAELTMPVLLFVGGADTPMMLAMADTLTAKAPRLTRMTLPGIGHMINLEANAPFNRALLEFLAH